MKQLAQRNGARVVLSALLCVSTVSAAPQADPPDYPPASVLPVAGNVVVIIADDVGHDLIGAYAETYPCNGCASGATAIPCTPNIDALTAAGVRFTNAWASPLCTPTRAQMLTGKRGSRIGIGRVTDPTKMRTGLDPDEITIADLIPVNGAIGKWHVLDPFQTWSHPLECGFFDFAGTMWNLGPPPMDGPSYIDWRKYDALSPPVQQTEYATTATTDDAIARLRELNQEQGPWLLWVAYHASHNPFHCPPNPVSPVACQDNWWRNCLTPCTYAGAHTCRIHAMVQVLDYELGRLLPKVDWTDTTVVFLGDNGSPFYAKTPPFVHGYKGQLYQGGVSVPLVARGPGITPGSEVHELVQVTDLFATMADIAGASVPASIENLDSVSFAPYLSPGYGEAKPRKYVYAELFEPNFIPVDGAPPPGYVAQYHHRTIRNARFKLIQRIDLGGPSYEFFEMADNTAGAPPLPHDPATTPDPHELVNLMPSLGTWSKLVSDNFVELMGQLQTNYPALPVN